jgi:branched-chain amino acid transport system ATP-binding protein
MLVVERIEAGYGSIRILFDLSLAVGPGEVVALLGRNGMGKTTAVRAIMGIIPCRKGAIHFAGQPIQDLAPHRIARLGIGLVPEDRQVFPTLTVRENLTATARRAHDGMAWTLGDIFQLFPQLLARQHHYGNQLSGGEQQMTAIGRALMTNPKLLILDEATEGLAPKVQAQIWQTLDVLKQRGLSVLVIDKNVAALAKICDRFCIVEKGRSVWQGRPAALAAAPAVREAHLGV